MSKQENKIILNLTLCGEAVSVESLPSETNIIDLTVKKVSDCEYALVGGKICYTVTIFNNSDVDFIKGQEEMGGIIFRDPLALNLSYVENSFNYEINDEEPIFVEPDIDDMTNIMTYDCLEIPANTTAVVKFCVKVERMPS